MQDMLILECNPLCGFLVRSRDEREIFVIAKQHVRHVHAQLASDEDIRSRIRPE